ncbi:DUF6180 family protein [Alcaligenes sp. Marseille-Q7550]|nr:hypothetical protein [Escherichia coli]
MLKLREWLMLAALSGAMASSLAQEAEPAGLQAERRSISSLSVAQCLDAVRRTAADEGYLQHTELNEPDQLGIYIGGAPIGGGSLVVYCIGLDQATAYIIQARSANSAILAAPRQLSDKIAQALTVTALR